MTENPLVALIATGTAPVETLATLALEQQRVIPADRRAFLHLAQRATAQPETADFFRTLAEGEAEAARRLTAFATACGVDEPRARTYEPLPGCQSYPAYVAWLSLNADPTDALLALTSNFAEWGAYCATIAKALRRHYAFTDEACAFFDFFAEPAPAAPRVEPTDKELVRQYSRALQHYEGSFWATLLPRP
jgi:pyrroloquinoline quinone (PQQ) biosynthesis protein C